MAETKKAAKQTAGSPDAFTAEERAAMKERAKEMRAAKSGKADPEADVLAKIAEMPDADRVLAEALHGLIKQIVPELAPRTWYGMPAYAKGGKVLCFFQSAAKFNARYATFGFQDVAGLDDGAMWPTSFALVEWTPAVEKRVKELVARAVS